MTDARARLFPPTRGKWRTVTGHDGVARLEVRTPAQTLFTRVMAAMGVAIILLGLTTAVLLYNVVTGNDEAVQARAAATAQRTEQAETLKALTAQVDALSAQLDEKDDAIAALTANNALLVQALTEAGIDLPPLQDVPATTRSSSGANARGNGADRDATPDASQTAPALPSLPTAAPTAAPSPIATPGRLCLPILNLCLG